MPKSKTTTADPSVLQMALVGYQLEKEKIEAKIRELQGALRGAKPNTAPAPQDQKPGAEKPKRVLSPAARRRIAAAQKKRWAEHRRQKAATAKQG